MNISSNKYSSIEQIRDQLQHKQTAGKKTAQSEATDSASFKQLLYKANVQETKLKFSKHANERLISRNIHLTQEQMEKLCEGTNRAKAKGINESLVVVDGLSFIVSCKSHTVITAVGNEEEHIFTNIDGAVIM